MRLKILVTLLILTGISVQGVYSQVTADRIAILEDYHGYYPCMDCHADQEPVTTPRILEEDHYEPLEWEDDEGVVHTVPYGRLVAISDLLGQTNSDDLAGQDLVRIGNRIRIDNYMEYNGLSPADSVWTLIHGAGNLWCLDCHDTKDRDKLIRLDGELLTFNESQLLCGGCHGSILRDWDAGIHGTTSGYWDTTRDAEGASIRKICVECHSPHAPAFQPLMPMAGPVTRLDAPHGSHDQAHPEGAPHEEESH